MRTALTLLVLTGLLGSAGPRAQEMPRPPAELKKLERLLGNWEASGTATHEPGGEQMPWTSVSSVQRAMNGFFLQEDIVIDLGEEVPTPLVFRSFYGYDRENGRYMTISISNMGPPTASEIHWADDDTMISIETSIEKGQLVIDRWVTKLGTDTMSFVGHRTIGAGQPFVWVEGRMTRTDKAVEPRAVAATISFAPVGPEMTKLNRMAGTYRLRGTFQAAPEMEPMAISGKEVVEPLFDGAVLEVKVMGDEVPEMSTYEAWGALGWNANKGCYTTVYVNSMGEIAESEARWVGNQLVNTYSGLYMGQPSVMRSVRELDEKGVIKRAYSHNLMGTSEPIKLFEARYERE